MPHMSSHPHVRGLDDTFCSPGCDVETRFKSTEGKKIAFVTRDADGSGVLKTQGKSLFWSSHQQKHLT